MRKVLVLGASGSGKTTVARVLANRLAVPHVELDSLYHGSDWIPRPTFADDVDRATLAPAWIVDGNYSAVRDLLWARADTVIWMDLPRWLVEWQVVTRTAGRLLFRKQLWNGNRERWRDIPRSDHPIRWTWRKHGEYRRDYGARFADPGNHSKELVRLRSRRQTDRWLRTVARSGGARPAAPTSPTSPTPPMIGQR